ncbi:acetate/propionate family kinase [Pusillimonas sp. CC-YST705]|uniref:Acetate kinase n=1 Tax=Mesopusillimonas faecipullorum TaxID=2755040 RepID=A0ABS8CEP2_9BURK|nr:acetate/propionate family kinase [Mesopusillimonas faecipullorum]MCB5364514.1 acetate/propionate family kinase [Mesopusillimonas faecipullorum]
MTVTFYTRSGPIAKPALHDRYQTRGELILVLNCGSSSIKFALFDQLNLLAEPVWNGKVQGIGGPKPDFGETGITPYPITLDAEYPYRGALQCIRERVLARLEGRSIGVIVHRVVHGGNKYFEPVRVSADVVADLRSYIPLAPLHQPFALEAMEILLSESPTLPQVACFDTAFHRHLPDVEQRLPLPRVLCNDTGLRRYGFHGLSYAYMAVALAQRHGDLARGRTIVAHLGSGASLCALKNLSSVATTMGFSALEGLMMGTRTGSIDPGVLLYLMQVRSCSPEQVAHMLYHESGLLGVSQRSAEPRVLLACEDQDEHAAQALALYVRRIVREIGALAAVLGGLDLLVFTAGVGEHLPEIRRRVCEALEGLLGIQLNSQANQDNAPLISSVDSAVVVGVEPTNEEWMAACQAQNLLAN